MSCTVSGKVPVKLGWTHRIAREVQPSAQRPFDSSPRDANGSAPRVVQARALFEPFTPGPRFGSGLHTQGKLRSTYDIVGLGEAMVDYSGTVNHEYLNAKDIECGGRRVIGVDERALTIEELEAHSFQLNAGGSLANTLSGVAVLGRAAHELDATEVPAPSIGMSGCIGSDHLGKYFRQQLQNSGVQWVGQSVPNTSTGTVIVLTTPDAQRSFLSFPSASQLQMCPSTAAGVASARVVIIEGYLWETPNAEESINRAIALARAAGSVVVMTAADVSVVRRHRDAMLRAAAASDLLFANAAEAQELIRGGEDPVDEADSPRNASGYAAEERDCLELGQICPMAAVTRGSRGSCVAALGQLHVIPPHWAKDAPVDTCGAGDAYAAGFLHAYLRGMTVRQMGEFGAACASSVLSRHAPNLSPDDARSLVTSLNACLAVSSNELSV